MGKKRRILVHDTEGAVFGRKRRDVPPLHRHRPLIRRHQPRDDVDQQGLARTGRAKEHVVGSFRDFKAADRKSKSPVFLFNPCQREHGGTPLFLKEF